MKAFKGTPFTSMSTYSITTVPNDSGVFSKAASKFSSTCACRIASSIFRCASTLKGSAASKANCSAFNRSASSFSA
eukprot:scaffold776_cov347-Pavlova_lutheri.AAC.10